VNLNLSVAWTLVVLAVGVVGLAAVVMLAMLATGFLDAL
jgi:hypothetical protein